MTILVTGASGHLGTNLLAELRDEHVRALVHVDPRPAAAGVEVIQGDVLDPASLARAMKGVDCVFHLAARISITGDQGGLVTETNVEGARNVARAARETGARMVHVSSVHAYDLSAGGPVTESSPKSGDRNYAYDRSKALGEEAVRREIARGLDATILNPTGILGPQDPIPSRMGKTLLSLAAGRMPALVRGGFDWVDVRDVARTAVAAKDRGATGENYLVGGHHATIPELAQIVAEVADVRAPRLALPWWVAVLGVPFARWFQGADPLYTYESLGALRHGHEVDSSKAREQLGHRARPLQESVRDFLEAP